MRYFSMFHSTLSNLAWSSLLKVFQADFFSSQTVTNVDTTHWTEKNRPFSTLTEIITYVPFLPKVFDECLIIASKDLCLIEWTTHLLQSSLILSYCIFTTNFCMMIYHDTISNHNRCYKGETMKKILFSIPISVAYFYKYINEKSTLNDRLVTSTRHFIYIW
jgi:hypothetical protein